MEINAREVRTLMEKVWIILIEGKILGQNHRSTENQSNHGVNFCKFQMTLGHTLQDCPKFLAMIQKMMDNSEVEFHEEVGQKKKSH